MKESVKKTTNTGIHFISFTNVEVIVHILGLLTIHNYSEVPIIRSPFVELLAESGL